jgi:hypothetical protein
VAPFRPAVDIGDGAGDLTLDLLDGKPGPVGKLGVARAIEPPAESGLFQVS